MRFLSLVIFFSLITVVVLNAQITWEQLEPHNRETYIIVHQHKGNLYAIDRGNSFYFSEDLGASWLKIKDEFIFIYPGWGDVFHNYIRNDAGGNTYFFDRFKIYKFDIQTLELELYQDFSALEKINNFQILPGDKTLLVADEVIAIYDKDQNLEHQAELESGVNHIHTNKQDLIVIRQLILPDNKQVIFEFDLDLKKTKQYDFPFQYGEDYWLEGDRLYSTQGWFNRITSEMHSFDFLTNSTKKMLVKGDSVLCEQLYNRYLSYDGGLEYEKFDLRGTFTNANGQYFVDFIDSILIKSPTTCTVDYLNRFYLATGETSKHQLDFGLPHANTVFAAKNENLIVEHCNRLKMYFKKDRQSEWLTPGHSNPQDGNPLRFDYTLELPNGDLLSREIHDIFRSKDGGSTWGFDEELPVEALRWWRTPEGVFLHTPNFIFFSADGENWEGLNAEPLNELYRIILNKEYAFRRTYDSGYCDLERLHLNEGKVDTITPPDCLYLSSAVSRTDDKIYFGGPNMTGDSLVFMVFDNSEESFTTHVFDFDHQWSYEFQLETDYLGNVFFLGKDTGIFMSSDDGQSWQNITPQGYPISEVKHVNISFQNEIYLATIGGGVFKSSDFYIDNCVTSIKEATERISIYPNPTTGRIIFEFSAPLSNHAVISFFNLSGDEVYQTAFSNRKYLNTDISILPSGIYFYKITDGIEIQYNGKIILH